jgi:transcriptional regulator with XRE-family HTH domain
MSTPPTKAVASQVDGTTSFRRLGRLLLALVLAAAPALAQTPPAPNAVPSTKMDDGMRELSKAPLMKSLSQQQQMDLIEFVTGNMLFVGFHELGHAIIQELGLPVLGREEDAADSFATLAMLKIGTDFSDRVLVQAARGWFLMDRRDRKEHDMLLFYDEHGLDKQRAYQIVCLMVGFDEDRFEELADWVQMPAARQDTCAGDFSNAQFSWKAELKPHLRGPDQPKSKIDVDYEPVSGKLEVYARALRAIGFLETIAGYAADLVVWPHPIGLVMQSCDDANAAWKEAVRKEILCYELAQDFVELYRGYTENPKVTGRMPTNQLLARNIKRLRIQQGMSQDHLATDSGVDKTWVDGMEGGRQDATVAQLEQLARALKVETAELFKQEDAQATQAAKSIQPTQPTPATPATRKHESQAKRRARK